MDNIKFNMPILAQGLSSSIQCLEISYCSLSINDLHVISNYFINLNSLSLVKVTLIKISNDTEHVCCEYEKELFLNKLVLLKVDHEILDYLKNTQTCELEITDSNENSTNQLSLLKFVFNQRHLVCLTIGEMSNNASVFFHSDIPFNNACFKLKKLHTIFCSSHSHLLQFESNFLSFLSTHSESLESIKLSGRLLPPNVYKFVVKSLRNLKTLEIDASCIPQENSFYQEMPKNVGLKSLTIASTVSKNNFNGIKELLCHYPNITKLELMDTDEFIPNDLFHSISWYLTNLNELSVLNFNKSFNSQSKIKSLEKFSVKIITNLEQLVRFVNIHASSLKTLSIWWIIRDFESHIINEIISLPNLNYLKIGGRFIANKRIYEVVKRDSKNLKTMHLIVNNYDEVKHLKFTFPADKALYHGLRCSYFEEYHDREPLND